MNKLIIKNKLKLLLAIIITNGISIYANQANVLDAKIHCNKYNICSFSVTIKHNDTSWEHYVNAYEILTMNNKLLATRTLYHPHINEQPFTRSISNVKIPKGTKTLKIRAHDLIHGYSGKEFILEIM